MPGSGSKCWLRPESYRLIRNIDQEETDVSTSLSSDERTPWESRRAPCTLGGPTRELTYYHVLFFLNICIFACSIVIFAASTNMRSQCRVEATHFSCNVSDNFAGFDIPVVLKTMHATLVMTDEPDSIFRQDPSPEVDKAWLKISDTRPFGVSKETVVALGKDPAKAVKFDGSFNLNYEAYAARLDILHQVHCLDAVRREVYWDHYYAQAYPKGRASTSELHKLHVSHCLHYLLQNIMCNANLNIYTHIWTDTFSHPYPDFNVTRQCRSFDAILDFQREHALDQQAFVEMTRPLDSPDPAEMVRKFKEIHHYYDNHEDDGRAGNVVG